MKKILLGLCIAAFVLPLFADDALVMPSHVIRTYLVGVYANVPSAYDNDGKKQSLDDKISVFNLGAAVEYGVNDWVTGAVQWVPGYNISSKIDNQDKATLADTADLFVGAKLQIVGPKAPVQNESIRFAIDPGIKIEVLVPDFLGNRESANRIFKAKPFVFNHNLETVPDLYPQVRSNAVYHRSLELLKWAKQNGLTTKSGLMLGLGEKTEDVLYTINDLK